MNRDAKDNAVWTLLGALMMLIFGWYVSLSGTSTSAFYNATVALFTWTLRIGGIAMFAVAILCFAGLRIALLLDAIVAGLSGLVLVGSPLYWLVTDGLNVVDLVYIIFGFTFLNAARGSWGAYAASGSSEPSRTAEPAGQAAPPHSWLGIPAPRPAQAPPPPKAEPPHPASIRPKSLATDAPPPDGYLAALAKEDEEPPSASYK